MNKLTKTNTSYCNVKVAKKTTWKYIFDSSTQNVVLALYTHPSCFNLHMNLFMKSSPWPYTSPQECMKPIACNHRAKQSPLHILVQYLASYQSASSAKTELVCVI